MRASTCSPHHALLVRRLGVDLGGRLDGLLGARSSRGLAEDLGQLAAALGGGRPITYAALCALGLTPILDALGPDVARRVRARRLDAYTLFARLHRRLVAPATTAPVAPEVLIVGAGMAGLAAAEVLVERGVSVAIVEAASRAGGRAARAPHAAPLFETGASWLHSGDTNPLTSVAEHLGFDVRDADGPQHVFGAGESIAAGARYLEREDLLADRIRHANDRFAHPSDPWDHLVLLGLGPLSLGVEPEEVSAHDFLHLAPEIGDRLVVEGLDHVVGAYAHGLDIRFDTPVSRIERHPNGIRAHTPRGAIDARAVIVTVSTGVLASGAITFAPELPTAYHDRFAALPMGVLEKVMLRFDDRVLEGVVPMSVARQLLDPHGVEWLLRPFGRPVAVALVGGRRARVLLGQDDEHVVRALVPGLEHIVGRPVGAHVQRAVVTRYCQDPLFGGSYSAARSGSERARRPLAPLGALHFAGEAWNERWGTTLAGAWASGRRAAREVVSQLRRVPRAA